MKITTPKFNSQKELFAYLVTNKADIFAMKKAEMKKTDLVGDLVKAEAIKALNTSYTDDVASGIIKRMIILNTYNWLDSHDDVHIDGIFLKSITDVTPDKKFHLHDHLQMVTAKVGVPFEFAEKAISWKDMGIDCEGETVALCMRSNIMRELNSQVFGQYLRKEIKQHSVGMQYVNLDLAVNDPDYKPEYATFSKYIGGIGNKSKALEQGYFWAIKEAKLIEGSAVLAGSNELTPTVDNESKSKEEKTERSFYQLLAEGMKAHQSTKEKSFYGKLLG